MTLSERCHQRNEDGVATDRQLSLTGYPVLMLASRSRGGTEYLGLAVGSPDVLQMLKPDSVETERSTIPHRHDGMSNSERQDLWNEMSIFPVMGKRQVDVAVEDI
ncbi:hypothetical protein RB195_022960 [Necator americanus]|uniref:Uncharacterized protein n=1 Tax=Necator americanus TaxID=51031 RepID=A0ABR1EH91_NECAM